MGKSNTDQRRTLLQRVNLIERELPEAVFGLRGWYQRQLEVVMEILAGIERANLYAAQLDAKKRELADLQGRLELPWWRRWWLRNWKP